jgi:hypothetical protein
VEFHGGGGGNDLAGAVDDLNLQFMFSALNVLEHKRRLLEIRTVGAAVEQDSNPAVGADTAPAAQFEPDGDVAAVVVYGLLAYGAQDPDRDGVLRRRGTVRENQSHCAA